MYFSIVLVCHSLINSEMEHVFICLLAIQIFSSIIAYSYSLPTFFIRLFILFLLICKTSSLRLITTHLFIVYITYIFFQSVASLFTLFMVSYDVPKFLIFIFISVINLLYSGYSGREIFKYHRTTRLKHGFSM